jgi:hypothetical protein
MGWGPEQVENCSLWQFNTMFDGWLTSKGIEAKPDMLTDDWFDEFDELTKG